jgi:hypothetical protein
MPVRRALYTSPALKANDLLSRDFPLRIPLMAGCSQFSAGTGCLIIKAPAKFQGADVARFGWVIRR